MKGGVPPDAPKLAETAAPTATLIWDEDPVMDKGENLGVTMMARSAVAVRLLRISVTVNLCRNVPVLVGPPLSTPAGERTSPGARLVADHV